MDLTGHIVTRLSKVSQKNSWYQKVFRIHEIVLKAKNKYYKLCEYDLRGNKNTFNIFYQVSLPKTQLVDNPKNVHAQNPYSWSDSFDSSILRKLDRHHDSELLHKNTNLSRPQYTFLATLKDFNNPPNEHVQHKKPKSKTPVQSTPSPTTSVPRATRTQPRKSPLVESIDSYVFGYISDNNGAQSKLYVGKLNEADKTANFFDDNKIWDLSSLNLTPEPFYLKVGTKVQYAFKLSRNNIVYLTGTITHLRKDYKQLEGIVHFQEDRRDEKEYVVFDTKKYETITIKTSSSQVKIPNFITNVSKFQSYKTDKRELLRYRSSWKLA